MEGVLEKIEINKNIWLCAIGAEFWVDERTLYLEGTFFGEKSRFFKI